MPVNTVGSSSSGLAAEVKQLTKLLLDLKRSLHLGLKIACMSKTTNLDPKTEHLVVPKSPQKTKLEKTQSWLTIISTSVGLLGIAGSTFAFAVSSFYTGSIDVKPDFDTPGMVVKVYTSEGHESVFHTKHINLMPGQYHLEIVSPNGRVIHRDTKVSFHHNSDIYVTLGPPPQGSTISANPVDATSSDSSQPEAKDGLGALVNFGATASGGSASNSTSEPASSTAGVSEPVAKSTDESSAAGKDSAESSTETAEGAATKKRWWQVWKRGDKEASSNESSGENSK